MKTRHILLAIALTAVAISVAAWGCGGNGIEATENADLFVVSEQIELTASGTAEFSENQPSLELENIGQGEMAVQVVEWVERPERLEAFFRGPVTEADADVHCESDADCSEGGICLTHLNSCRDLGFKELPDMVRPDATFTQSLVLRESDEIVECPELSDPDSVPEGVRDGYCGEIAVETNALNSDDVVTNGNATIYIIGDPASGELALPNTFIEFINARPGETQTEQFVVENLISSPLTIERINFGENETWFEVTPAPSGAVIEGNSSQTFTLAMTPSESEGDDFSFDSSVSFDSSSTESEPGMTVRVTSGVGNVPEIEVDPMQLSFEESNTQPLRIYNHGNATLPLTGMEIRPGGEVEGYYSVMYEGTNVVDDSSALDNVPPASGDEPGVRDFTVEFDAPEDASTTVGELRINHGESMGTTRTTVSLFGDSATVAIGEILPTSINFRSDSGGEPQTRTMSITNQGNDDLEITDVELVEQSPQTSIENYEIEGLDDLVVPAGGVAEATITYSGETEAVQDLAVSVGSNHAGAPQAMQFRVTGNNVSPPTMEVSIDPSYTTAAGVDEVTTFEVIDDTGQAQVQQATWLLHERPAGSQATLVGNGSEATIQADVAGDYRISVIVSDGDREVQEVLDFVAQ